MLDNPIDNKTAVDFLAGKALDNRGRNVTMYLNMLECEMEADHQWIQWAFPIDTASPHNPDAPLLDENCITHDGYFKYGNAESNNQTLLVHKYMRSIGIFVPLEVLRPAGYQQFKDGGYARGELIVFAANSSAGTEVFCDTSKFCRVIDSPHNHHIKRISRVLKHLRFTGKGDTAAKILRCIMRWPLNSGFADDPVVSIWTVAYWMSVVYNYDGEPYLKECNKL